MLKTLAMCMILSSCGTTTTTCPSCPGTPKPTPEGPGPAPTPGPKANIIDYINNQPVPRVIYDECAKSYMKGVTEYGFDMNKMAFDKGTLENKGSELVLEWKDDSDYMKICTLTVTTDKDCRYKSANGLCEVL